VAIKADPRAVSFDPVEPLAAECRHFLDCLAGRATPLTDGREGLRVLAVLEAASRSLERGGEAVAGTDRREARSAQIDPTAFVHETAIVDPGARIGARTKVWHFAHVLAGSTVGAGCSIGQNVMIGPDVSVGDGCKIQNNVSVYKGVTLEDHVFCGPSMVFTNVLNPRAGIPRMDELRETRVGAGATIGANATIVCGTTIGRHAFVGAGAVVTRGLACAACGKRYRAAGEAIVPAG
jgi:UDP-2-acetamido-3-amino-2,3-dideoxy-glucuronate N-acetyltransferase